MKKKPKKPPKDRRRKSRTVHTVNDRTSYRDELLARTELTSFFLKVQP